MIHTPPLMQVGWDLSLSLLSETLCHGFTSPLMPPCDQGTQNSYLLGSISNIVKLNRVTCATIKEGHGEGGTLGQTFWVSFWEHPIVKGSCTDTHLGHLDGRPHSVRLQEKPFLTPILQSKKPKSERYSPIRLQFNCSDH